MDFTIEITENVGCQMATTYADQSFKAHHNGTVIHSGLAHFSDPNAEIITLTGHEINPTQSFMTIDATHTMVTLSDPANSDVGNYSVSIY